MLPMAMGGIDPKMIKYALIALAVGGGGYLLYNAYHSANQDNAQANLDNSPEAQQANNMLKLLHPKTYKTLNVLTTFTNPLSIIDIVADKLAITDKNAIVQAGAGIKNFDLVSKYYKELTKDTLNLPDDIRNTLNAEQQKRFFKSISLAVNTKQSDTKPFYIYAAPSAGTTAVSTFEDANLKKPLLGYLKGTRLGMVSKLITSPYVGKDGVVVPVQMFYLKMDIGKNAGKYVYVLSSQVSKTKPA